MSDRQRMTSILSHDQFEAPKCENYQRFPNES